MFTPLHAEFVFLKDGGIVEGKIVSESASAVTVTVKDANKRIERSKILRVIYTELTLAKMLVQKKAGDSFTAYLVDEDRDNYIFRKELYKNVEFSYKRSEILFLAERNPSGLKGEAGTNDIKLSWYVPYDPMKKYNVYWKKEKNDKWDLQQVSKSNSCEMEDLPSNTRYFIGVTGGDKNGDETVISNIMEIKTLNIVPESPKIAVFSTDNANVNVTWDGAIDKDGKIVKYKIISKYDGKETTLGEVKNTKYSFKKSVLFDRLYVIAVDDMKGESSRKTVTNASGNSDYEFSVEPGIILPLSKFADVVGLGLGGSIVFTINDFLYEDVSLSPELGFYRFAGKDWYEDKKTNVDP